MLKKLFSGRRPAEAVDEADVADTAPPAPRPGGFRLGVLWFVAFLFAALAFGAVAFMVYGEMDAQRAAQQAASQQSEGEGLTADMVAHVQALTDAVERAAAQPALAAVMAGGDPAAQAAAADAVAATLPGALRVRLLPPGAVQTDDTSSPRLGYAALELAHQAEAGRRPGLEIHWLGAPDQYIAVARPVGAGQQPPVGVLLVAFDPKILERWVSASLPAGSYAEVRQTADSPVVIAAGGDKARSAAPATGSAPLAGTHWELAWWLPPPEPLSLEAQLRFFAPFAIGVAALGLLLALFGTINSRMVRADLGRLVAHMIDLRQHRRNHGHTARLRDFRQAVEELDEQCGAEPVSAPQSPSLRQPVPVLVPENPLFIPESTIKVEEVDTPGDKQ